MLRRAVHWRYLWGEAIYRRKRVLLTVGGIALTVAMVVLLDMLGRAFVDVAALPFRSLSADLIVQRNATQTAMPKQMGIMPPYSAQPISTGELRRLTAVLGVGRISHPMAQPAAQLGFVPVPGCHQAVHARLPAACELRSVGNGDDDAAGDARLPPVAASASS